MSRLTVNSNYKKNETNVKYNGCHCCHAECDFILKTAQIRSELPEWMQPIIFWIIFPPLHFNPRVHFHHKGYDIASRDPVWWQQRDENSKAYDCKVKVEKPRQQLEGVRRPAPPVCSGAQGYVSSPWCAIAHRHRAVWVPAAQVHERMGPSSPVSEALLQ